jgi:hypothetical protein
MIQKSLKVTCSLDYGSWAEYSNIPHPNQNSAAILWIYSTNKSAPANRKKCFYTNRDPNQQEVGFFFV